ncbi:hypothetical protein [Haliea sp. E17]|uniref:hypothetical protein n=1 Tax=Haliea sp. E17 TaxID=3401576 RepID=UPI003AAD90C9
MKKRYLAIAALLALPFGQASAEVILKDQSLFESDRHPASLPTTNYRGGKWQDYSGSYAGGSMGHGGWSGAWSDHGKGCRSVKRYVEFKKHPVFGYPLYRAVVTKVCPSPH